jgi:hypothetical protein
MGRSSDRVPYQLIFTAGDVGDLHVVGGRRQIFEFLAGEDVNGSKMDLGVTVFAGLGGGHFDDLAGTAFDDDETVLPQGGTLHGISGRSASISTIEGVLMLCIQVSQMLAECMRLPHERDGGVTSRRKAEYEPARHLGCPPW